MAKTAEEMVEIMKKAKDHAWVAHKRAQAAGNVDSSKEFLTEYYCIAGLMGDLDIEGGI